MVYRVFVEKLPEFANEAAALKNDLVSFLGVAGIKNLRIINRYDVENIKKELFEYAEKTVFSEPQTDKIFGSLQVSPEDFVFAVEYLPGQFDQRADSAAQCIQLISKTERPDVCTAKVYVIEGSLIEKDKLAVKKYVINPVESREASLNTRETLKTDYKIPDSVKTINGFIGLSQEELKQFISDYSLAMDLDDIEFCRKYFEGEHRDPTITEIRMIDTYWSDHCRHTTFLTTIDLVRCEDPLVQKAYEEYLSVRRRIGRKKPQNLMDIATIGAKYLKQQGLLDKLDESEEINACTVKIKVTVDKEEQDWLLLFKNETHNHPTEIEPFGGAATCIGGAIRDPLSGRSYVYAAMRVTGAGNPLRSPAETLSGKLPQRKIVTTAAAGYSSYGNQIGLATGIVDEIYHEGYAAKRMEIGAVIAATPKENVRREAPVAGDVVILLGGKTGRDGCGGATGSSKSHTLESLSTCGAEVQKGNAPEERKLQRLFRCRAAMQMVKRCNDFGAGGVSVAVGELADGLVINLNAVTRKYDGLDGTELAISESQERMAVVVAPEDADNFIALAQKENLEATVIATVQKSPRLVMNWNGKEIVNISRDFLDSNGAEKHTDIVVPAAKDFSRKTKTGFCDEMTALAGDLNICSKRGLSERFDSTIGANTVLMPFGGKNQQTPIQAMVHTIACEHGKTSDCSFMSWGYNPQITEKSVYHGAYLAVVESVSKLVAAGADDNDVYLTFQEYFNRPGHDPLRWGQPLGALLGALKAQEDLGIAAIGGKDSMSGTFESIDVPPTLVSFAVTTGKAENVVSPEFKGAGHDVVLLKPEYDEDGLPVTASLKKTYKTVTRLMREGRVLAAWTPTMGGIAEGLMKMSFGNSVGIEIDSSLSLDELFGYNYGAFVLELSAGEPAGEKIGVTISDAKLSRAGDTISLDSLFETYENKLEPVYPSKAEESTAKQPEVSFTAVSYPSPAIKTMKPRVLIPVFPGTNCEYDTAKAMQSAGAEPDVFVIKNLSAAAVGESVTEFAKRVRNSQIIFIPGGFSGGDEPDGSGKFITAFFRNGEIREQVNLLLKTRDGLMCGICNGFQALIKLGLVPYGEIVDTSSTDPTLTFNTIGRHQSRLVRTRVASNKSPWLAKTVPGEIYTVPVSHGEGRFIAPNDVLKKLAANGQIATQYADLDGNATSNILFNPNNSDWAIEGITSPDGRVLGKMGHSERTGENLYKNVEGKYDMGIFNSAVDYFRI